ncbi:cytochrome c oxidase subunit II [Sphingobacterium pedocola]|uniref:cytochrome c oxidase subunit II n=1 Tax=Sphingobacterium pedocola TaxID=2082722 RepID=UPI001E446A53|nr:cytochrome c oxidase subunit II [Sphingobacterium pedocola]
MKLKINNRFKSILGCLLLISLFFAAPVLAYQQDSVVVDTIAGEETSASVSVEAIVADTATSVNGIAAGADSSAAAAGLSSDAASAASTAAEVKQIDPQVYKDFFYYVLLFLVICTVIAVVGKVISIYELTRKTEGKYNPLANNTLQAVLLLAFLVFFLWGVYYSYSVWGSWSWRDAVTEHGEKIDTMFIITLVITTFVMIVVHILLLSFAYIYRMRANRKAYFLPHNDTIEKIWTIVPAVVLTVLVLFGFFTWRSITSVPEDLQKSALQVEVLGEQFMWRVRYPGTDGEMGKRNYKLTTADNPYGIDFNDKTSWDDISGEHIVLPVGRSVRFHIISKDIIHSFFIPDFRVQINAVPGMTNYFQFTPTVTTEEMRDRMNDPKYDYVMLCNKICGSAHYNMQKKVVVVTEAEYKQWLGTQAKYFTEDLQKEFAQQNKEVEGITTASLN